MIISKKIIYDTIPERINYLKKIIKGEIKLEPGELNILSDPCKINENVKKIGGSFNFLSKGSYGKVYNVCIDKLCDYNFVLKESKYSNLWDNIYYPYRVENVEVTIFKLLNDLLLINATPHIPLYMGDFTCKINYEYYRYILVEKAEGTLVDLIKSPRNDIMKNVIFQILYTLKIIQKRYPNFIHNDLKPSNILYFTNPIEKNKFHRYILNGTTYIIPNLVKSAIWDFGLSSIIGENADNIMSEFYSRQESSLQTEKNHYKDIFRFLNILGEYLKNEKYMQETILFIKKYTKIPEKYLRHSGPITDKLLGLIPNIEPYTIEEMLHDNYFDSFRNNNISQELIIESYSDDLVNDMSMVRLSYPNTEILSSNMIFECEAYDDIIYFEYRDNYNKYNNQYRVNCYTSKNEPDIIESYEQIKDNFTIRYMNSSLLSLNIQKDQINDINNLFRILYTKYINTVYFPKKYIDIFTTIIKDKSIFIITKRHLLGVELYKEYENQKYDFIIQFNQFMNISKMENYLI